MGLAAGACVTVSVNLAKILPQTGIWLESECYVRTSASIPPCAMPSAS